MVAVRGGQPFVQSVFANGQGVARGEAQSRLPRNVVNLVDEEFAARRVSSCGPVHGRTEGRNKPRKGSMVIMEERELFLHRLSVRSGCEATSDLYLLVDVDPGLRLG